MSSKKQIEEMAREICQLERDCNECWHNGVCQAKKYAKRAINAGYRKVVTSDWLTKGISEEQLEREKQEALDEFAEKLGYRKQSVGEWVSVEGDVIFKCSICDAEISTSWDYENDDMWGFCPCCGANMKGGEG